MQFFIDDRCRSHLLPCFLCVNIKEYDETADDYVPFGSHLGKNMIFFAWEQQRCLTACASAQSVQHHCYSLSGKYNSLIVDWLILLY